MISILGWLVGPIGRYVLAAGAVLGAGLWAINHFENVGAAKERARIEEVNRNAETKAAAGRAASERGSDSGGLSDSDGWRRD